jgi:hypothetical protein
VEVHYLAEKEQEEQQFVTDYIVNELSTVVSEVW